MATVRIQSTYHPPEKISEADWELYLKLRSEKKMKLIRRLNDQLNRILNQSMTR